MEKAILAALDNAHEPRDMNLPGLRLHELVGEYAGYWAVNVSGSWRVIFRFESLSQIQLEVVDG